MGFFTTSDRHGYSTVRRGRVTGAVLGVIAAIVAVILLFSAISTVPQSEVAFAVGGGPLDPSRKKVKGELMEPGLHVTGLADTIWKFPSNKTPRFQDFDVTITTVDGKKAQLLGQVGFRFVGEKDPTMAKEFATGVGSRKYGGHRPGEDDTGWENFLTQMVSPEINASFKQHFGTTFCADFEPACRAIDPRENVPESDPETVYAAAADLLQQKVDAKLGDSYLQDMTVRVNEIRLPEEVQTNIDAVTAEQARTKAAEQREATTEAEVRIIEKKAKALKKNKGLIALEVARECKLAGPQGCTIILDGTGTADPAVNAGG